MSALPRNATVGLGPNVDSLIKANRSNGLSSFADKLYSVAAG